MPLFSVMAGGAIMPGVLPNAMPMMGAPGRNPYGQPVYAMVFFPFFC